MLRAFRPSDIPSYIDLYSTHFVPEATVLLADPAAYRRTLERALRWRFRALLAVASALGRPIVRLFAWEESGTLAGVAFLFFEGPTGYVASVVVGTPFQRRGIGRRLMEAAQSATARTGRRFVRLDVLRDNEPGKRLYDELGFRPFRRAAYFVRDLGPTEPPLPPPPREPDSGEIRLFHPRDGRALAEIAKARQPAEEREFHPVGPRSFRVPPLMVRALGSESAAFVLASPDGPKGFVRVTAGGAGGAGNLVPPLVAEGVPRESAEALLSRGLGWFRTRPVRRIVTQIPLDDRSAVEWMERTGFRNVLEMEQRVRALPP